MNNNKSLPSLKEAYRKSKQDVHERTAGMIRENVQTFENLATKPAGLKEMAESIVALEELSEVAAKLVPSLKTYMSEVRRELTSSVNKDSASATGFESVIHKYATLTEFFSGESLREAMKKEPTADSVFEVYTNAKTASLLGEAVLEQFKPVAAEVAKLSPRQVGLFAEQMPKVSPVLSEGTISKIAAEYLTEQANVEQLMQHVDLLSAAVKQLESVAGTLPEEFQNTREGIAQFANRFNAGIAGDKKQVAALAGQADNVFSMFYMLSQWPRLEVVFKPLVAAIDKANEEEKKSGGPRKMTNIGADVETPKAAAIKAFNDAFQKFFVQPVVSSAKKRKGRFEKFKNLLGKGTTDFPQELSPDRLRQDMINAIESDDNAAAAQPAAAAAPQEPVTEEQTPMDKALNEDWNKLTKALNTLASAGKRAKATAPEAPAAPQQQQQPASAGQQQQQGGGQPQQQQAAQGSAAPAPPPPEKTPEEIQGTVVQHVANLPVDQAVKYIEPILMAIKDPQMTQDVKRALRSSAFTSATQAAAPGPFTQPPQGQGN